LASRGQSRLDNTKVNMQLQDKAILVKLAISLPGNTRTDVQITAETLSAHSMGAKAGRWLKQLYPDEAMTPLVKLQGEIRTYHYEHTLPWSDEGYRILPTAHHAEYTDAMRAFRSRYDSARDYFVANLDRWIEWAKVAHNGTFDGSCYPTADKLERKFGLDLDFSPIPSGQDFRTDLAIDADAMAAMESAVNDRASQATEAARTELWHRLSEPLAAMAAKLSEPDRANGQSPIFRDSLVSNLQSIAALIPALNVTSDAQLAAFAAEVQTTVAQAQPDTLRQSKADRTETARKAAEILSRMSGYMPTPKAE
jgi:hypothetical protein